MKGVGTFLVKIELDQSAKKTKKMWGGGGGREEPWGRGWAWRGLICPLLTVVQFCSVHGSVH